MNLEDALNSLQEKSWRSNKRMFAESEFDKFIAHLQASKDAIIEESLDDIASAEEMITESQEDFNFPAFKSWMHKCVKNNIKAESEDW